MSLIIKAMQIKAMKYYHISVRMAVIKREKREKKTLECLCKHCGKQYEGHSKKIKIELPYVPVNPLIGIYLKRGKL